VKKGKQSILTILTQLKGLFFVFFIFLLKHTVLENVKGALRKSLSFCRTMPPLATSESAGGKGVVENFGFSFHLSPC